jgi:hypothetical protein
MAKKSQASFAKRQKELARQEKQRQKQARKLESKERKASTGTEDEDPDIAGIRLGPQPLSEEELAEEE